MKNRVLAAILSVCILTSVPASRNEVSAASRQLNLQTTFGTSTTTLYGVPTAFTTRFTQVSREVAVFYKANFNINLKFSKPTTNYVIRSSADDCRATLGNCNFDSLCQHVPNSQCNNSGPYHCTNMWEVKRDVFSATNSNYIQMHITATEMCATKSNALHKSLYGVQFTDLGSINDKYIIVRDYDYTLLSNPLGNTADTSCVTKTMAHEIGHLYGVEDHYDIEYGDSRDDCIWGKNKEDENVRDGLLYCSVCKATIIANADRYNHS